MNKSQIFWDKQAKRYDYSERQFEPVFNEVIAKTKEYLNANDNVLDFGCATGTKTLELAGATNQILGIDISDEMIKEAKDELGGLIAKALNKVSREVIDEKTHVELIDKALNELEQQQIAQ